jgi:hypothetical protein
MDLQLGRDSGVCLNRATTTWAAILIKSGYSQTVTSLNIFIKITAIYDMLLPFDFIM